jgi:hypothetical protein
MCVGRVHSSDLMELFYLGHVDPGESDLETALRETEEESGLTKADLHILADFNKTIKVGIFVFFIYEYRLAYFPSIAWVFIYPNLIVICVPSLAKIAHFDGIFSIITSKLLGGTLLLFPRHCPGIYLSQSYSHISVEYPTVNSFTFHVTR